MKEQQIPSYHPNPQRLGANLFNRLNNNPNFYIALLVASYVILLTVSYSFGYVAGSSLFGNKDISTFVISKTLSNRQSPVAESSSKNAMTSQCSDRVPPELVRKTITDWVYNGKSPYEDFDGGQISSSIPPKGVMKEWDSYGAIYKSLIHKVRPKTIIKLSTFFSASATYMASLTSKLGLRTQILCFDEFHGWPGDLFEDIAMPNGGATTLEQFIQSIISQNATESILPVPLSTTDALERLCELGIYGDLIEIDVGHDFHSAWSDINRAYKLLRPGGVLFGHNYFTSYYNKGVIQAVRLFARVNNFQVKADKQHWMINSA